jgi:hypothetical protein
VNVTAVSPDSGACHTRHDGQTHRNRRNDRYTIVQIFPRDSQLALDNHSGCAVATYQAPITAVKASQ